jgi:hypothetical protein
MQLFVTIALIACLGLIVVVGFLRVLRDLLARDYGEPSASEQGVGPID